MVDILKKNLAPMAQEAWTEIEDQARKTLTGNLTARGIVDFDGPHGWELASINLGKVSFAKSGVIDGVLSGNRQVLALTEVRVPFSISVDELDGISRGLKDPDLGPVEIAAQKAAHFEEKAIFRGFKKGGIQGIFPALETKAVTLKKGKAEFQGVVEEGVVSIQKSGIAGPYNLILGTMPWQILMQGDEKGYPLKKRVEEILGGQILWSPALEGGAIVSSRGGDFILTVGQDFSIGYAGHDAEKINLYLTESFTFQVLEPRAAVEIKMAK